MREYGKKRGGAEFEYPMVLFLRLRGYYGWTRVVEMLSAVLRDLAEGVAGPDYVWKMDLPRTTYQSQTTVMRVMMTCEIRRTRARGHQSQRTLYRGERDEGGRRTSVTGGDLLMYTVSICAAYAAHREACMCYGRLRVLGEMDTNYTEFLCLTGDSTAGVGE